jgi:hypothetical protein
MSVREERSAEVTVAREGTDWTVRANNGAPLVRFFGKEAAISLARDVAKGAAPSELTVRRRDGSIECRERFMRPTTCCTRRGRCRA